MDEEGFELDVLLQKRRNKKAAIRFLSRLLNAYPKPRVIVTDKLRSYMKPIQQMSKGTEHRSQKILNYDGIIENRKINFFDCFVLKCTERLGVKWILSEL